MNRATSGRPGQTGTSFRKTWPASWAFSREHLSRIKRQGLPSELLNTKLKKWLEDLDPFFDQVASLSRVMSLSP